MLVQIRTCTHLLALSLGLASQLHVKKICTRTRLPVTRRRVWIALPDITTNFAYKCRPHQRTSFQSPLWSRWVSSSPLLSDPAKRPPSPSAYLQPPMRRPSIAIDVNRSNYASSGALINPFLQILLLLITQQFKQSDVFEDLCSPRHDKMCRN